MQDLDVSITVKPKARQTSKSVIIKAQVKTQCYLQEKIFRKLLRQEKVALRR